MFEDLAVMVISGLGLGSRDFAFLALDAAASTSAILLLKVRGMAPVDSDDLKSWELEDLMGAESSGEEGSEAWGRPGESESNLARLGVEWEGGADTGVTVRAALR